MEMFTREYLADLIFKKMSSELEVKKKEFSQLGRINSCYIDDLLPRDIAMNIYNAFPSPDEMNIYKSLRENKRIAAQMDLYNPLLEEIVYAFQDKNVLSLIESITGLKNMVPDEDLYAGGISLMTRGNFLNPHLDNSHDNDRVHYRVLNLLYYCTPGWEIDFGGNLELWDNGVNNEQRTVHSRFNRLAIMITNKTSYHSVSKVVVDGKRCCVSNYYFSKIPAEKAEYFHVTSFYGRPEEPLKTIFLKLDTLIRQKIRVLLGKKISKTSHIYKKK